MVDGMVARGAHKGGPQFLLVLFKQQPTGCSIHMKVERLSCWNYKNHTVRYQTKWLLV
eukprot:SAG31_NODE_12147_length_964_cov_1.301734_2_plen_57_part_01